MKAIYIILSFASLIIILMLGLSFFYLDQQRHQTFLYALYRDGVLTGHEEVDRYKLENSLIYKSVNEPARDIMHRKTIRRIAFDARGKNFIDYRKEVLGNGSKSLTRILKDEGGISFMATDNADFSYLEGVSTYGNDILFECMSLATYPALVRRYNFKKRGEQFVTAFTPVPAFLPPYRNIVSITSVGRDTIEIEDRNINCERLIAELKNGDLISIWTTGTFHNVLMVHIPRHGFKAVLCTKKRPIPVKEYGRKSELYVEKDVKFTNEEITLSGTLSVPTFIKGPYPAVLLIWDSGPMDRNALGVFTDIAHALAGAGYCVLRFDKRGIGRSQGFFSTYARQEEISDLKCALGFLRSRPEVDKSRIALLGHSEGGFYATYLAGLDKDIRACIIMSALSSLSPLKNNCRELGNFIKKIVPDDNEYLESAIAAVKKSRDIIKDKSDWITVLGERVFTKKMLFENKYNPVETMKKIRVPILILHGREDDINSVEEAENLGGALAEAGNSNFTTVYFGELGHYFGGVVKSPPVRDHIEVNLEVLKSLTTWFDKNLLPPLAEPVPEEEASDEEPAAAKPGENI